MIFLPSHTRIFGKQKQLPFSKKTDSRICELMRLFKNRNTLPEKTFDRIGGARLDEYGALVKGVWLFWFYGSCILQFLIMGAGWYME